MHSVEALLRWHHPRLGELAPGLFVKIAEESSAIIPIGRWVLERACADLAAADWPAVNINVSRPAAAIAVASWTTSGAALADAAWPRAGCGSRSPRASSCMPTTRGR